MAGRYVTICVYPNGIIVYLYEVSAKIPLSTNPVLFENLPDAVSVGDEIFEKAFETAVSQIDLSGCDSAVLLLSSDFCFFRVTELPFKAKGKIEQVLPLELASGFPVENEDFLTRFQVVKQPMYLSSDKKVHTVFSASVKDSYVELYFKALGRHGVKPAFIAPKSLALCASFLKSRKDIENFVILVPEGNKTTAVLVKDRQPVLVRTVNSIRPSVVPSELNRMILGFLQTGQKNTGFHLFLVGTDNTDGSDQKLLRSLDKTLEYQARLTGEQTRGSESETLTCELIPGESLLQALSPERAIQGGFNLCKGKYGSDSFWRKNFKELITTGLLAVFVFIFFMGSLYNRIEDIEDKIAGKRKVAEDIFVQTFPNKKLMNLDPLLAMQAQMKAEEKKGGSRSKKQTGRGESETGVVEILYELSRQIPASIDTELERLVFDRKRLILSGSTPNFNTVDQIKGYIEKSDVFKSVEIGSAASRKDGKRVEFKFIVEM